MGRLKWHLQEVNAIIAVAQHLRALPLVWAPYRAYMRLKDMPGQVAPARRAQEEAEAARQFFQVALPAYAPHTPVDLARLRQDKRLALLRQEIMSAALSGDVLDPRYPQRVYEEVLGIEKRLRPLRRIAAIASTILSAIPVYGLGLAARGLGAAVVKAAEGRLRRQDAWFYLISDGRTGF